MKITAYSTFMLLLLPMALFASESGLRLMENSYNAIPPDRMQKTVDLAVRGDSQAAFELWLHHALVEDNIQEGEFWLRLAAEQGNCHAVIEFAKFSYRYRNDAQAAVRWLETADALQCNTLRDDVTSLREELQDISSKSR